MSKSRPNVVFILGDNVGWGDIGCYGGVAPTPRIDALAAQGLRFKNYNVEAQCTPTRSAICAMPSPARRIYYGSDAAVMSVKWKTKVVFRYTESASGPISKPGQEFDGYP